MTIGTTTAADWVAGAMLTTPGASGFGATGAELWAKAAGAKPNKATVANKKRFI
jgi:hypothetical protein